MTYFYHEGLEGHEEIKIFDGNNFMLFMFFMVINRNLDECKGSYSINHSCNAARWDSARSAPANWRVYRNYKIARIKPRLRGAYFGITFEALFLGVSL
jgi:hypothetical protein